MQSLLKLADRIDNVIDRLGHILSWLVGFTVITCAAVAFLRYSLGLGWVWMQDAYVWANAVLFMLGAGPTLLHDKHVRVDFIYGARSWRYRAMIDFLGSILLLLPSTFAIFVLCLPYVRDSWSRWESTLDVGGMPGTYLFKSVLLLFCIPFAAQGISLAIRSYVRLAANNAAGEPVR